MCLGIPAQIVDLDGGHPDLVIADFSGAHKPINLGLVADEGVEVGDWVVVHMGFALERMTAEAAADALDALETIGPGTDQPLAHAPPGWVEEDPW